MSALAKTNETAITASQTELIRQSFCNGMPSEHVTMFLQVCQRTGLDPFKKQIYGFAQKGALQIIVSIQGLRTVAMRSGTYGGQGAPLYCGDDGKWRDVWLSSSPPLACKVTVKTKGGESVTDVALWAEYKSNNAVWSKYPTTMLAKVAEAKCLRKMFPDDVGDLYVEEEFSQEIPDAADAVEAMASAATIEEAIEVGKQWAHLSGQARIQLNNSYKNKISELKNAQ